MAEAKIGLIGGSGLYQMEGLTSDRELEVSTPFGAPSDRIVIGTLEKTRVAFLPRHGKGHVFSPTEIPARANIYALKSLGVERIVSISAVGSLKEGVRPLDMVVPDQIIDRTRGRVDTFFGDGLVAHVGFADPYCPVLNEALLGAAKQNAATSHAGGTYVVIEGPQFSTRAESELYRSWGASVIGMTVLPEAKLAREAEICYSTLALVTDYDVWHESEDEVTVEMIIANLLKNVAASQKVIRSLVADPALSRERRCPCASALKNAIITSPDRVGDAARKRLSAIAGRYLQGADASDC